MVMRAVRSARSAAFFFVFFGAGSVSAAFTANANASAVVIEPVNYALSFGFGITVLAFAIGNLSGGHINPAVTVAMLVTGNLSPTRALMYIPMQIAGGLCGGGLKRLALDGHNYYSGIGLDQHVTPGQGFIFEFMGTLLLIFVVFNVAVWTGRPLENDIGTTTVSALAPLPIGLAVAVSHLTLGPFTGCGINPARVIGAVVYEDNFWQGRAGENFWIYILGPLAASFAGPAIYYVLHGTFKPGDIGGPPAKVVDSSTTEA